MTQADQAQADDDDDRLHREAAELLCRIADGDRGAFGDLYDRLSGPLLALCLSMLSDRADAEDTLQEVFLIVWGRATLYDPALGKAISWLMTITRNKCLDRLRSSKRKRRAIENARKEMLLMPSGDGGRDPLGSKEKQDLLRAALGQLPELQRKAIGLAFLKGYTQVEIAELLNQPLGTIKARIRRGLIQMRDLLYRADDPGDGGGEDVKS